MSRHNTEQTPGACLDNTYQEVLCRFNRIKDEMAVSPPEECCPCGCGCSCNCNCSCPVECKPKKDEFICEKVTTTKIGGNNKEYIEETVIERSMLVDNGIQTTTKRMIKKFDKCGQCEMEVEEENRCKDNPAILQRNSYIEDFQSQCNFTTGKQQERNKDCCCDNLHTTSASSNEMETNCKNLRPFKCYTCTCENCSSGLQPPSTECCDQRDQQMTACSKQSYSCNNHHQRQSVDACQTMSRSYTDPNNEEHDCSWAMLARNSESTKKRECDCGDISALRYQSFSSSSLELGNEPAQDCSRNSFQNESRSRNRTRTCSTEVIDNISQPTFHRSPSSSPCRPMEKSQVVTSVNCTTDCTTNCTATQQTLPANDKRKCCCTKKDDFAASYKQCQYSNDHISNICAPTQQRSTPKYQNVSFQDTIVNDCTENTVSGSNHSIISRRNYRQQTCATETTTPRNNEKCYGSENFENRSKQQSFADECLQNDCSCPLSSTRKSTACPPPRSKQNFSCRSTSRRSKQGGSCDRIDNVATSQYQTQAECFSVSATPRKNECECSTGRQVSRRSKKCCVSECSANVTAPSCKPQSCPNDLIKSITAPQCPPQDQCFLICSTPRRTETCSYNECTTDVTAPPLLASKQSFSGRSTSKRSKFCCPCEQNGTGAANTTQYQTQQQCYSRKSEMSCPNECNADLSTPPCLPNKQSFTGRSTSKRTKQVSSCECTADVSAPAFRSDTLRQSYRTQSYPSESVCTPQYQRAEPCSPISAASRRNEMNYTATSAVCNEPNYPGRTFSRRNTVSYPNEAIANVSALSIFPSDSLCRSFKEQSQPRELIDEVTAPTYQNTEHSFQNHSQRTSNQRSSTGELVDHIVAPSSYVSDTPLRTNALSTANITYPSRYDNISAPTHQTEEQRCIKRSIPSYPTIYNKSATQILAAQMGTSPSPLVSSTSDDPVDEVLSTRKKISTRRATPYRTVSFRSSTQIKAISPVVSKLTAGFPEVSRLNSYQSDNIRAISSPGFHNLPTGGRSSERLTNASEQLQEKSMCCDCCCTLPKRSKENASRDKTNLNEYIGPAADTSTHTQEIIDNITEPTYIICAEDDTGSVLDSNTQKHGSASSAHFENICSITEPTYHSISTDSKSNINDNLTTAIHNSLLSHKSEAGEKVEKRHCNKAVQTTSSQKLAEFIVSEDSGVVVLINDSDKATQTGSKNYLDSLLTASTTQSNSTQRSSFTQRSSATQQTAYSNEVLQHVSTPHYIEPLTSEEQRQKLMEEYGAQANAMKHVRISQKAPSEIEKTPTKESERSIQNVHDIRDVAVKELSYESSFQPNRDSQQSTYSSETLQHVSTPHYLEPVTSAANKENTTQTSQMIADGIQSATQTSKIITTDSIQGTQNSRIQHATQTFQTITTDGIQGTLSSRIQHATQTSQTISDGIQSSIQTSQIITADGIQGNSRIQNATQTSQIIKIDAIQGTQSSQIQSQTETLSSLTFSSSSTQPTSITQQSTSEVLQHVSTPHYIEPLTSQEQRQILTEQSAAQENAAKHVRISQKAPSEIQTSLANEAKRAIDNSQDIGNAPDKKLSYESSFQPTRDSQQSTYSGEVLQNVSTPHYIEPLTSLQSNTITNQAATQTSEIIRNQIQNATQTSQTITAKGIQDQSQIEMLSSLTYNSSSTQPTSFSQESTTSTSQYFTAQSQADWRQTIAEQTARDQNKPQTESHKSSTSSYPSNTQPTSFIQKSASQSVNKNLKEAETQTDSLLLTQRSIQSACSDQQQSLTEKLSNIQPTDSARQSSYTNEVIQNASIPRYLTQAGSLERNSSQPIYDRVPSSQAATDDSQEAQTYQRLTSTSYYPSSTPQSPSTQPSTYSSEFGSVISKTASVAQRTSVAQQTSVVQETSAAQQNSAAQETSAAQQISAAQQTSVAQETSVPQQISAAQQTSMAQQSIYSNQVNQNVSQTRYVRAVSSLEQPIMEENDSQTMYEFLQATQRNQEVQAFESLNDQVRVSQPGTDSIQAPQTQRLTSISPQSNNNTQTAKSKDNEAEVQKFTRSTSIQPGQEQATQTSRVLDETALRQCDVIVTFKQPIDKNEAEDETLVPLYYKDSMSQPSCSRTQSTYSDEANQRDSIMSEKRTPTLIAEPTDRLSILNQDQQQEYSSTASSSSCNDSSTWAGSSAAQSAYSSEVLQAIPLPCCCCQQGVQLLTDEQSTASSDEVSSYHMSDVLSTAIDTCDQLLAALIIPKHFDQEIVMERVYRPILRRLDQENTNITIERSLIPRHFDQEITIKIDKQRQKITTFSPSTRSIHRELMATSSRAHSRRTSPNEDSEKRKRLKQLSECVKRKEEKK